MNWNLHLKISTNQEQVNYFSCRISSSHHHHHHHHHHLTFLTLSVLDMPKRPNWNYKMDKRQVEQNEESMFREYIRNIKEEHPGTELGYFEMNLEVLLPPSICVMKQISCFIRLDTNLYLDLATTVEGSGSFQHSHHHHRCTLPSKYDFIWLLTAN